MDEYFTIDKKQKAIAIKNMNLTSEQKYSKFQYILIHKNLTQFSTDFQITNGSNTILQLINYTSCGIVRRERKKKRKCFQ